MINENESNEQVQPEEMSGDAQNQENQKESAEVKQESLNLEELSKEELAEKYKELLAENKTLTETNSKLSVSLKEADEKANDSFDKYRRGLAELENVRKRAQNERQEFAKYANFKIIEDLLIILDDFQRAIDSAKAGNVNFENYQEGIEMIEKQFIDLLFKKYGVVKYGEQGDDFDPNIHQGMMMEEGDFEKEIIVDVFRKGFTLHDRVIRPAQVKVGKPKD